MSDKLINRIEGQESNECSGPIDFMKTEMARRGFIKVGFGGLLSLIATQQTLNRALAQVGSSRSTARAKSVILLWMGGGPTHIDTWDPKPGTRNGGSTRAINTRASGVQISHHFPQVAEQMDKICVIRSMTSNEADHTRATYFLQTGYKPNPTMVHPHIGSMVSKELGEKAPQYPLPHFVSINGGTLGAGFLGAGHNAFVVQNPTRPVDNLELPKGMDDQRFRERLTFLNYFEEKVWKATGDTKVKARYDVYNKALNMMSPQVRQVLDITEEPARLTQAYGDNNFGKGCLLARRMVESAVKSGTSTFIEVHNGGWDMHNGIAAALDRKMPELDAAMATLIKDLAERQLLNDVIVLWMGEFGRTPNINNNEGRDHYSRAFSVALAGGGIRGGRVIGATNAEGGEVVDRKVTVPDLIATLYSILGIDAAKVIYNTLGRPMRLVDPEGAPIQELLA